VQERFRMPVTLAGQLLELKVSPQQVLRQAGLPLGLLDQEKIWMTTPERFAFYEALTEISQDLSIGLKLGSEDRLDRFSPIAIIAIYSRTFRNAIQRIGRYKRLTCPQDILLRENGPECSVQFLWLVAQEEEPPVLIDQCFSWIAQDRRCRARPRAQPPNVAAQTERRRRYLPGLGARSSPGIIPARS
jgi:hypothetical protein